MGLFDHFGPIGKKVKGLLGDDAFFDKLGRAQAFLHGDYVNAARIGDSIRRRRDEDRALADFFPEEDDALSGAPKIGVPGGEDSIARARHAVLRIPGDRDSSAAFDWVLPGESESEPLRIGKRVGGYRYLGGDPRHPSRWQA